MLGVYHDEFHEVCSLAAADRPPRANHLLKDRLGRSTTWHPFRWLWFNECLLVHDAQGIYLGAVQRRFSIFSKSWTYSVLGARC